MLDTFALKGPFRFVSGFGWRTDLSAELEPLTDNPDAHRHSPLVLFEDGQALGPEHALHDSIFKIGSGHHSFWRGHLYFSTSDNSDPNRNGRCYTVSNRTPAPTPGPLPLELTTLFDGSGRAHVATYEKLLRRTARPVSPFGSVRNKFIIGFSARVGSTLLCEHLLPYGVFVDEFFNNTLISSNAFVSNACDYEEYCRLLVGKYAPAGNWGLKAHIQSLLPLFFVGEFPKNALLWRYVHVTRQDVIRQAISAIIARETQAWISSDIPIREVKETEYSREGIDAMIANIRASETHWEKFFAMFEIEPLRLTYEEIAGDPAACAARVAQHCGLVLGGGGENLVAPFRYPALQRQSMELNAAWEAQYRNGR